MKYFIAISGLTVLSTCTLDVATNRYATLADARADQLFGRGWLPDVLPESSFNIRTINNLDLNTSDGEFLFRPDDSHHLFQQLHRGAPKNVRSPEHSDTISAKEHRGYSVWSLQKDQTTWVFFCRAADGRCIYTMWSDRNSPNNSSQPSPLRGSS
ncbi:hypothetical protein ACLMM6_13790 [Xanthomonas campestris pv. incanae]|uniref:hypothetical protein n=1 Tax=Xanthomonas campestris TaxID=339 RepID=UPI0029C4AFFA|nr:hypothetical protein [Xanthomonas campestris]MDX6084051.1 hypothetical protein [Xanthomonas campestris pv. incanae]